ncbi:MAG: histidinol-phosphate transaminase [Saprospiraceae bacterium]|nr:histidinol-phosphate transaminase [Saprospiraceae bacterium]
MNLESLIRPNIIRLKPYASARHEFTGTGDVFLDANENPYESGVNRYPDPLQQALKQRISTLKKIPTECIFLGNGSDEAIDLILRIFCTPGEDQIMVLPPTYGMYQVSADIADVDVIKVRLDNDFQPDIQAIKSAITPNTKVLFLCSPNNPTGNRLDQSLVLELLDYFKGIVVVDEAYIDFCADHTLLPFLKNYDHLIIMQTLSKAWGMAAVRLGMAFASPQLIGYFNKVKAPYNINILTQRFVLDRLSREEEMKQQVKQLQEEKLKLIDAFKTMKEVVQVYPSDSNFLLIKCLHADEVYSGLIQQGIVVRNRSKEPGCEGCLRITVGTAEENSILLDHMKS